MLHLTSNNFTVEINRSTLPVVVRFCEVEIDESALLAADYGADTVPTFAFFLRGRCLGTMQGLLDETIFERRLQKIFRNS